MSALKFETGQTVYDEHGAAAHYVAADADGHIVRPLIEVDGWDDEPGYEDVGSPVLWRNVYPVAPVEKFSEELKVLHEQIAAAKKSLSDAEEESRRRGRERAEKFKRFSILDQLEDFIDGKITHYVTTDTYDPPEIIPVEKALCGGDRYRKELRLLTLGGDLNDKGIRWKLGQYSDASGGSSGVIPATSLEQAQENVKVSVARHFADFRSQISQGRARESWIGAAEQFGFAVPEEYRLAVAKSRLQQLISNTEYNRRQADSYAELVAKSDAEIAKLQAYLAQGATA